VSLSLANGDGSLPVAYRLYLPQAWASDEARRKKAGVPERVDLACRVLEDLASGPQSQLEFGAMMVLREWRAGRLNVS
jgi:SRSO17 transposase